MISNLNPGLSQRVVRALHNRLRQALNMDSAVPETAAAVPETATAMPGTAAAEPETEEVNADARISWPFVQR